MKNHLNQFLTNHQLPDAYLTSAQAHFSPLIKSILTQHQQTQSTITLGINGSQGSGKTTLADYLNTVLTHEHKLNVVSLSIDDFYLSHQARQDLANNVHPLLATRGVPGTHDVALAMQTIEALKKPGRLAIPRFDKTTDDIVAPSLWQTVQAPVDVIILEGWCVGATPQSEEALIEPINALEKQQDKDGCWRSYVNNRLKLEYQQLFAQVDSWAMLKAPSFDCIYQWRLEQEHKLKLKIAEQANDVMNDGIMSDEAIKEFVMYFQRITQHLLIHMPQKADALFFLDSQRNIT